MIADYLMRGIDNLFSQKLVKSFASQKDNSHNLDSHLIKQQSNKYVFSKDNIKNNLHKIIRYTPNTKENHSRSPSINKSRLKMILQNKKQNRIRSVIRKNQSKSPQRNISPYRKIQTSISPKQNFDNLEDHSQSKIVHFRQQRKKMNKSRIFNRDYSKSRIKYYQ